MTANDYNRRQFEEGNLTAEHIKTLTMHWQQYHGLAVDGMCGPLTRASIDAESASSKLSVEALEIAISWIGQGEEGGNNSGPFVESLHGLVYDGDKDDDGAWCAAMVSSCFEEAALKLDIELPFRRSAGAKELFDRIGKAGRFVKVPNIQPGDAVCWDRGKVGSWQGHIGITEYYDAATGLLTSIEGNVGRYPSKVRRFIHDLSMDDRLEGFARV